MDKEGDRSRRLGRQKKDADTEVKIKIEKLKPQMNEMIDGFRDKLVGAPEFRDALVEDYMHGRNPHRTDKVIFSRGKYEYSVFLMDIPEDQYYIPSDAVTYSGIRRLIVKRTRLYNSRSRAGRTEEIELRVYHEEYTNHESQLGYSSPSELIFEKNSPLALAKARNFLNEF